MKTLNYGCGCSFDILYEDQNMTRIGFDPQAVLESEHLCQKTWDYISSGRTKGVFQLESPLGRSLAKKLAPQNIEHLSALMAIMRPGCISYDTKVIVQAYTQPNGRYKFVRVSMKDLYENRSKYKTIVSYNEKLGVIESNVIKNVVLTGTKAIYQVLFRRHTREIVGKNSSFNLKCTLDHKVLTKTGWKPVGHLSKGERFLTIKYAGSQKPKKYIDGKSGFRNVCFKNYEYKCIFCDWKDASLDVNHIDGNRHSNNEADNLCFMCPNHHKMYSEGLLSKSDVVQAREYTRLEPKHDVEWSEFIGTEFVEDGEVFDISMEAPHHNFIAGNVVVHNCMESMIGNKSVTQHYIDRKHGREQVEYYHPSLEPALRSTYGLLVYQEQAMQIVRDIAGFNLMEADTLRKAIGKKLPEEMAKVKAMFLIKSKELGIVTEEEAEEIFGWIEKSQRYSFNKSHSISYAFNGYLSAFCKAHFQRPFFTSYLYNSKEKAKQSSEVNELVNDARTCNVTICVPDFRRIITSSTVENLNPAMHFMLREKVIYAGFSDILGIGEAAIDKLLKLIPEIETLLGKRYTEWSSLEFLLFCSTKMAMPVVTAMIEAGCFDYTGKTRTELLYNYNALKKLTDKEIEYVKQLYIAFASEITESTELVVLLKQMVQEGTGRGKGISNKNRLKLVGDIVTTLEEPPISLADSPDWIAGIEQSLLGIALTCTKVDGRDTSAANCTCREFREGATFNGYSIIAAQIVNVNEIKTKNGKDPGQKMAFITISDTTGSLENVVAFPETWKECKGLLVSGNIVLVGGEKGKDNSLIVKKVWQI